MADDKKKCQNKKWKDYSIGLKVLIIIGGIIAVAGLFVLFGFIVMWLWNWLMPKLFGLPAIGYWEAWGLVILAHILFGGIHGSKERGNKRRLRNRIQEMPNGDAPEEKPAAE